MIFNVIDFLEREKKEKTKKYGIENTAYSLEIVVFPMSYKDYLRIVAQIRYYCKNDNVSWICGYSTTDSKSAKIIIDRKGKIGRPKKKILGKKVAGHCHNTFVGAEKSCFKTVEKIKKAIDKKHNKKICKIVSLGNNVHFFNTIGYIEKQSDIIRTGGNFNFLKYYKERR